MKKTKEMRGFKLCMLISVLIVSSCSSNNEETIIEERQGFNMLMIGNSFFKPYAEKLDLMAADAGFDNHNSTIVFKGGDGGTAYSLWNNSASSEHLLIKETLDAGGVEYFGMTAGNLPTNPAAGHSAWINYALQNNPDVIIFISIPPFDFPMDWDQTAQNFGHNTIEEAYADFIDYIHRVVVDPLREEFPTTKIFSIPTGLVTFNLAQMQESDLLLDNITLFGPKDTSIFTDTKGHQGEIVRETGGLLWLHSIYGVNLTMNSYETGFHTNLHGLANQIMNSHNPNYKQ